MIIIFFAAPDHDKLYIGRKFRDNYNDGHLQLDCNILIWVDEQRSWRHGVHRELFIYNIAE